MRLTHAAKDLAALHPRRAYWHSAANNTNRHKWSMMDLEALKSDLMARIDAAGDVAALEDIRVSALGKKGEITAQMKQLGGLDPEARKAAGQALNALKDVIAGALDAKKSGFADAELNARLAT